jgi:hypothetical protein
MVKIHGKKGVEEVPWLWHEVTGIFRFSNRVVVLGRRGIVNVPYDVVMFQSISLSSYNLMLLTITCIVYFIRNLSSDNTTNDSLGIAEIYAIKN